MGKGVENYFKSAKSAERKFMQLGFFRGRKVHTICPHYAFHFSMAMVHQIQLIRGNSPGLYRGEKISLQMLLSYSQAVPGRKAKQGQEDISCNHVQRLFLGSVSDDSSITFKGQKTDLIMIVSPIKGTVCGGTKEGGSERKINPNQGVQISRMRGGRALRVVRPSPSPPDKTEFAQKKFAVCK